MGDMGRYMLYSRTKLLSDLLDLHLSRSIERYKEPAEMTSYQEKMKRARAVVPNLRDAIEKDMDGIIARGEELDKKREQAANAHRAALDADYDTLDGFEHDLDEFSNIRPTLKNGDGGEKVIVTGAEEVADNATFPDKIGS